MTVEHNGINYTKPKVYLLADTGIGNAEFAARTCYNSFDKSEHDCIQTIDDLIQVEDPNISMINHHLREASDIEDSELLKQLSFVAFHHSVLEHNVVSMFFKGISRGVLQELARHRIASYSVKSTRYTLDQLMYYFIVAKYIVDDVTSKDYFIEQSLKLDLFVTADENYNRIELAGIWDKLNFHSDIIGAEEMFATIIPKANIEDFKNSTNDEEALEVLSRKKKRNVGDSFKHIITDNFKTDVTMTVNLRALKNFLDLRLSGAAWFQIRWLAEGIKEVLPQHCKNLIFKKDK